MRVTNIRVVTGGNGLAQLKASFNKNWKLYLMEALGLAIFMVSACFFGAMLEGNDGLLHKAIKDEYIRLLLMGVLMGTTALFIFYAPFTAPSGSHINPAITTTFLRLGKMCPWDAIFFIIFQFMGGLAAVYIMARLQGSILTHPPVNYVCTVPGKYGVATAAITEFVIAFLMLAMVLFTSANGKLKQHTRVIAACFVCLFVIVAGPVSGFGMNPARTLASAIPAGTFTAFWIYMAMPFAGMLTAAEFFLFIQRNKNTSTGITNPAQTQL